MRRGKNEDKAYEEGRRRGRRIRRNNGERKIKGDERN